jgi:hypothetical protein
LQVSRLQSKLLGALQTSAAVTSPMYVAFIADARSMTTQIRNFRVERQRGGSKTRIRPGYVGGSLGMTAHIVGIAETERVVYNPGI